MYQDFFFFWQFNFHKTCVSCWWFSFLRILWKKNNRTRNLMESCTCVCVFFCLFLFFFVFVLINYIFGSCTHLIKVPCGCFPWHDWASMPGHVQYFQAHILYNVNSDPSGCIRFDLTLQKDTSFQENGNSKSWCVGFSEDTDMFSYSVTPLKRPWAHSFNNSTVTGGCK